MSMSKYKLSLFELNNRDMSNSKLGFMRIIVKEVFVG